jgi:aspartate carbamoyltransferase catalytic subunit
MQTLMSAHPTRAISALAKTESTGTRASAKQAGRVLTAKRVSIGNGWSTVDVGESRFCTTSILCYLFFSEYIDA